MKISELMSSPVYAIKPNSTIRELDVILAGRWISGVPVISEDGELLGLVSKTDATRALVEDSDLYLKKTEVWEIMCSDVIAVQAEESVNRVAQQMLDAKIHRVLVYNGSDMVGIVSTFDFLRAV
jgi:CBS domain-containing protein